MELLVVIGTIALLVGLLLPTLSRVRENARRSQCLGNVRQLAMAAFSYAADNNQTLPDCGSANAPLEAPLAPVTITLVSYTPINWNGIPAYVLPSVGGLLAPYLDNQSNVWQCPSAPAESFVLTGPDPYFGTRYPNAFKPNYNFLAGREMLKDAKLGGPVADLYKLREWTVRNVSGLRLTQLSPRRTATPNSGIVLFHDRASIYHSEGSKDIYNYVPDWHYYANFGYADGHAEGRSYPNVNGYLASLHGPIPQTWFGVDFEQTFPNQYANP